MRNFHTFNSDGTVKNCYPIQCVNMCDEKTIEWKYFKVLVGNNFWLYLYWLLNGTVSNKVVEEALHLEMINTYTCHTYKRVNYCYGDR